MNDARITLYLVGIFDALMVVIELFFTKQLMLWPLIGLVSILWVVLFYKGL